MPLFSIIVPVYKVEKYLKNCLDSIKNQTFSDFECVLIDDGSPDNSGLICDEYVECDSRFKVIHKENEGVAVARNVGIQNATGKYIAFADSDDWLEENTFEELNKILQGTTPQIVVFDYFKNFSSKVQTIHYELPAAKKNLLLSFPKNPGYMNYLWNKIFLRDFINANDVKFPEKVTLCEDLGFVFKAFFHADSVLHLDKALYHYNKANETSVTHNYTMKQYEDRLFITKEIINLISANNLCDEYFELVNFYKLYTKLMLVLYKNLRNNKLWKETFSEANKYIWQVPLRFDYKLLSWLCSKNLFKMAYIIQDLKK